MAREFLGTGWRFPLLPDAGGRLSYLSGEENVRQSVEVLLLTALGERVMRGDFGTRAPEMVFAPGGRKQQRLLETTLRDALRDREPRVDVLDLSVELDPQDESRATVSISYRIRRSNSKENLVFPYYLQQAGRR